MKNAFRAAISIVLALFFCVSLSSCDLFAPESAVKANKSADKPLNATLKDAETRYATAPTRKASTSGALTAKFRSKKTSDADPGVVISLKVSSERARRGSEAYFGLDARLSEECASVAKGLDALAGAADLANVASEWLSSHQIPGMPDVAKSAGEAASSGVPARIAKVLGAFFGAKIGIYSRMGSAVGANNLKIGYDGALDGKPVKREGWFKIPDAQVATGVPLADFSKVILPEFFVDDLSSREDTAEKKHLGDGRLEYSMSLGDDAARGAVDLLAKSVADFLIVPESESADFCRKVVNCLGKSASCSSGIEYSAVVNKREILDSSTLRGEISLKFDASALSEINDGLVESGALGTDAGKTLNAALAALVLVCAAGDDSSSEIEMRLGLDLEEFYYVGDSNVDFDAFDRELFKVEDDPRRIDADRITKRLNSDEVRAEARKILEKIDIPDRAKIDSLCEKIVKWLECDDFVTAFSVAKMAKRAISEYAQTAPESEKDSLNAVLSALRTELLKDRK